MKAFHNDPKIKEKYINRVKSHYEADEIIKGKYWENGKGCAVGCTIHGSDHKKFETELGIPEVIERSQDNNIGRSCIKFPIVISCTHEVA